jgi:pilus assembly protein CpaB
MLISRAVSRVHRFLLIHRRGLASLCLGLGVWLVLGEVRAGPPPTIGVWIAARDLPGGVVVSAADLRRTDFLEQSVPTSAAQDEQALLGRTLAAPLSRGEIVTSADLLGTGLLARYPGRAAIGLRIPDPEAAALLRPADHVDLVASDPQQAKPPETLVRDAVVLTLPRASTDLASPTSTGRLVVFAVPAPDVEHIASVGSALFLTPIWNR